MTSLSAKAAISSLFIYFQFALAIISGIVLFPLIINSVGAYRYGLWLATGEAISYILLGDLGVYAVLPWLVAGRIGANDYRAVRRHVSNAIAIGCSIGSFLLFSSLVMWFLDPSQLGIPTEIWNESLYPMMLLLVLYGLGYPLRAFNAVLIGAQDVFFGGFICILQSVLVIVLSILMVVSSSGISGLALATALPPLLVSIVACLRTMWKHPYAIRGIELPDFRGCLSLLREGFGTWLGGLGFRMMVASNGIILSLVGRPDWATIYAASGKIAQILTPMCSTVPDSGLVGISHVYATNNREQTRRSVVCLVLLYVVFPSFAAIGLLAANPAFVQWWIGPDLYAGHYVNSLTSVSVIVAGLAGGLVKLVSVVGWRQTVGWTTIVAGIAYALLGYLLVRWHGLVGLAEAGLCVWLCILLPLGAYLISNIYDVQFSDFIAVGVGRWLLITLPSLVIAFFLGTYLSRHPFWAFFASVLCTGAYGFLLRPTLALAPWPERVRHWLRRLRVITNPSAT